MLSGIELALLAWPLGWPLEGFMGGELISTEELVRILHEPDLRIFDCTTRLDYQPPGEATSLISLYPAWTRSRPDIFPARTFSIFKANSPSRARGLAS